jgi:hypothetical protein
VFLTETEAWKVKRPVEFGFLDYSDVEKRGRAVQRRCVWAHGWPPEYPVSELRRPISATYRGLTVVIR